VENVFDTDAIVSGVPAFNPNRSGPSPFSSAIAIETPEGEEGALRAALSSAALRSPANPQRRAPGAKSHTATMKTGGLRREECERDRNTLGL
jgi:hypothetical protein